jgi:hypothetical protein
MLLAMEDLCHIDCPFRILVDLIDLSGKIADKKVLRVLGR